MMWSVWVGSAPRSIRELKSMVMSDLDGVGVSVILGVVGGES